MAKNVARRLSRASQLDVVMGPSRAEARARRRSSPEQTSRRGKTKKKHSDLLTKPPVQSQAAKSAKGRQGGVFDF